MNVPPPPARPIGTSTASSRRMPTTRRCCGALGLVIDCVLPAGLADRSGRCRGDRGAGCDGARAEWGEPHAARATTRVRARRGTRTRSASRRRRGRPTTNAACCGWRTRTTAGTEAKDSQFDVFQVDPDGARAQDRQLPADRAAPRRRRASPLGPPGEVTYTHRRQAAGGRAAVRRPRRVAARARRRSRRTPRRRRSRIRPSSRSARRRMSCSSPRTCCAATASTSSRFRAAQRRTGTRCAAAMASIASSARPTPIDGLPGRRGVCEGGIDHQQRRSARRSGRPLPARNAVPMDRLEPRRAAARTHAARRASIPRPACRAKCRKTSTDEAATSGNGLAVTLRRGERHPAQTALRRPVPLPRAHRRSGGQQPRCSTIHRSRQTRTATRARRLLAVRAGRSAGAGAAARLSEGESLERMVIRSNWNADTDAYLTAADIRRRASLAARLRRLRVHRRERAARRATEVVAAPVRAARRCSTRCSATRRASRAAYAIAAREAGTLYDQVPGDQRRADHAAVAGQRGDDEHGAAAAAVARQPDRRPAGAGPVRHPSREAVIETPYLPDGGGRTAWRCAAMPGQSLPGVSGPVVLGSRAPRCVHGAERRSWCCVGARTPRSGPTRAGFRHRPRRAAGDAHRSVLRRDSSPTTALPKWDEDEARADALRREGPHRPAAVRELRPTSAFIDAFGLPDVGRLRRRAPVRARHGAWRAASWMITPYRSLVLVHATQQPVCEPEFLVLSAAPRDRRSARPLSRRGCACTGRAPASSRSRRTWKEWVDDLDEARPRARSISHGQLAKFC